MSPLVLELAVSKCLHDIEDGAEFIGDELLAKGIILKDTREGVKWKRA